MRKMLLKWYLKLTRPFDRTTLYRKGGIRGLSNLAWKLLAPDRTVIGEIRGQKMHLHLRDRDLPKYWLRDGDYEPGTGTLIQSLLRKGDTFVDVGTNIGYFSLLAAAAVGPRGRVVSFEPAPVNHALLLRNIALNGYKNITVEQAAVSDKNGKAALHLDKDDLSGLHTLCPDVGWFNRTLQVRTVTLDRYTVYNKIAPALVKIDIEGAEPLALAGMRQLLKKGRVQVLIEFVPSRLTALGKDPAALLDGMRKAGYRVYLVGKDGRLAESDNHAVLGIERNTAVENNILFRKVAR